MPVSSSFRLFAHRTMYPVPSPLRLLSPRSPRLAMPDLDVYPTLSYLDLLRPTVLPFSRPACACFQSETWRTRTRAAQVVHPLPMIIITLSFHFARTINISRFLFLLLSCPNIPGPVLFLPGCGSDGLGVTLAVVGEDAILLLMFLPVMTVTTLCTILPPPLLSLTYL